DRTHYSGCGTRLTAPEFLTSDMLYAMSGEWLAVSGRPSRSSRRGTMRVTKLVLIAALLVSAAPIGVYAQKSGGAAPKKSVIARSDVRELPADQQIIQALNRLTFGPRPGDVAKVRAIGLDNWI